MASDEMNVAYDLSLYDSSEDRQIARRAKKESKVINAAAKFNLGKRIFNILSGAVVLGLIIAIISTNRQVTAVTKSIAQEQARIVEMKSQRDYLNFTLGSKMTLDEIESYATGVLGMVKGDSSRIKYVELEDENKIEGYESPVKVKIEKALAPLVSFLMS